MRFSVLCMIIIVVSFLGFLVENVWLAATKGFIDNRNMCLPFLLGDGVAVAIIYMILGTPRKLVLFGRNFVAVSAMQGIVIYFWAVFVFVCIGEIVLGKIVEKTCRFCWWDYSKIPMHITKYTSIPTSIAFAAMIELFMYCIFEPLCQFFESWNSHILSVTSIIMMSLLIWDCMYNLYRMYIDKSMQNRWKIETKLYHKIHNMI